MVFKKLICCIAASVLVVCAASALIAAPRIVFDSEFVDLGKVVGNNGVLTVVFTFKNAGDADLDITGVEPSCGCIKAEAERSKLSPGESSTITALFNSSGYHGPIVKSVWVTTNDPAQDGFTLRFRVEIVALAKFKPERVNFGSLKINESRTHALRVNPGDPKTFKITKMVPRGSHVTAPEFKKVTAKTGDYWELTVLVKAGDKPARVMEWVDILTGCGANDKVSFMVYGNIVE